MKLKDKGVDLIIISDSNQVYIETVLKVLFIVDMYLLKANGMIDVFDRIITNPAWFDDSGKLNVKRYYDVSQPHECINKCAVNLCKGKELLVHRTSKTYEKIIYCGDGFNDYCPSTKLGGEDILLMRTGFGLEKKMNMYGNVQCQVLKWFTPSEFYARVNEIFE